MGKIRKQWKWMMLLLALSVWCAGCSDDDGGSSSNTPSNLLPNFHKTPDNDIEARIKELKRLLPEETYDEITKGSRNHPGCVEADNGLELGLPEENGQLIPNGQWYYTYENLIRGMAEWEEFAHKGDENTRKLEIAAFLANIAQETGAKTDEYGGPGCFIQEGHGGYWHSCEYGGCNNDPGCTGECPDGAGYCGRGPHQLSWNVNYKAFGEAMGLGDAYLNDPDELTRNPEIGIAGSIWFWGHAVGDNPEKPFKPSAHDVLLGRWEPTDADVACGRKTANFGVIINIINGGVECGPNAKNPEAAQNRVDYLSAIADAMGVVVPDSFPNNCSEQRNFAKCVSYPDPTWRCGRSWGDANTRCGQCCISNEDCTNGEECFQTNKPEDGGLKCTCVESFTCGK